MKTRTRTAFWLLATLAFGQILWWGFLITSQQSTLAAMIGTPEAASKAGQYRWMILAEGAFFLLVWCFGVFSVLLSYQKELLAQRAQKDFLSAITHELKSPISSVRLCLDTLERQDLPESQRSIYLGRAQSSLNQLLGEIESLLTIAQDPKGVSMETSDFNVGKLVEQIVSDAPESQRIEVSKSLHQLYGRAPIPQFRLILKSILENATRYHENVYDARVTIDLDSSSNEASLIVTDNGIGLTPAEQKDIFNPFFRGQSASRLSPGGSGLGLSLAKRIAERSGMKLMVSSAGPGKGTSVRLEFCKGATA